MSIESLIHKMELHFDPVDELRFRGPYTNTSSASLHLFNVSDHWIVFKLTSTHSEHFLARPRNGFVAPDTGATIAIDMQPVPKDMALDTYVAGTQKFKVEWRTLAEKPGPKETAADLFSKVNRKSTGGEVKEAKFLCRFDPVLDKNTCYKAVEGPADTGANQTDASGYSFGLKPWLLGILLLVGLLSFAAYKYRKQNIPDEVRIERVRSAWSKLKDYITLQNVLEFLDGNQDVIWSLVICQVIFICFLVVCLHRH